MTTTPFAKPFREGVLIAPSGYFTEVLIDPPTHMSKSIEDSHIARTIAEQIEEEKAEFEHYATVKVDDKSGPDDWDYKWRTYHIGARYDVVYIAQRSSDAEGVDVHNVRDVEERLTGIAFHASHHWENAEVEVSDLLEELAGDELDVPEFFLAPEAA